MDTTDQGMLFAHHYEDVPLDQPPLARVIGQLRFSNLSVLTSDGEAAQAFVRSLADDYPFGEQGVEQALVFSAGQPIRPSDVGPVWRLRSADQRSIVALTNGALTFETTAYKGHSDFCEELARLAGVLESVTRVPSFSRVAVRYTNRLAGSDRLGQLSELIRSELLGVARANLAAHAHMTYSLSQAHFRLDTGGSLLVQWGSLPANASIDPTLPSLEEPSWVLDMDASEEYPDVRQALPAKVDDVWTAANVCAERARDFFRWAVTDQFLIHFGGRP